MTMARLSLAISLTSLAAGGLALDNGFGRTPVMGFNTYNAKSCSIDQTYVRDTIEAFVAKGFPDLGYKFFQCNYTTKDLHYS